MRALAEEAGSLEEIGRHSLPQRVFAGGVEQVLARRLQRVPPEASDLLQLAAVMGRQLDLAVLGTLHRDRGAMVQQCMEAGVLDGQLRSTAQALRQVCTLVGWPLPTGAAGVVQDLARQGGRQLRRIFTGTQQAANTPEAVLHGLAAMSIQRRGDQRLAIERADRAMHAIVRARWPLLQLRFALIGALAAYLAAEKTALPALRSKIARSLREAEKHGTRFQQAHYWLGQLLRRTDGRGRSPDRREAEAYLQSALSLFEMLGATWDTDLCRRALGQIADPSGTGSAATMLG